jgi:CBS domain containing-hemolysin-like protein
VAHGSKACASGGAVDAPQEGSWAAEDLVMMLVYGMIALGFSFLCSVAEAVLLSITPSYIATLENDGARSDPVLKKMKSNIDRSLAAILTLNTIAHTVGAGGAGAEAAQYFGAKWIGIAMAVLTLLILFLSEIIPKTLGAVYWRSLAPLTGHFVQMLIWVLYPLIFVSESITKWLTGGKRHHVFNREEFTALADLGAEGGHLDAKESRILRNLFRFPTLRVEDIMTPRTVVFALQQDVTVEEVLTKYNEINFSRIPVYGEDRDDITGFVLKTDLLLNANAQKGHTKLRDLKREIRAVEQHTPLSQTLEELLDNRAHLLLVVGKYGGMQGLVTLEDVVETLIGIEIVDEADEIDDMRQLARQKWEDRMERIGIDVREGPPEADPVKPDTASVTPPGAAADDNVDNA